MLPESIDPVPVYQGDRVVIHKITPYCFFRKADLLERNQCNSVFIVGGDCIAIVDVPTIEAAVELEDEAAALFNLPIRYIVLTHPHTDHIGGLEHFTGKKVTIICSAKLTTELANRYKTAGFIGLGGKSTLHLGNLEVRFFTMGRTMHSPYDLFIHLPKDKILLTGDCVVDPWILYYHNADVTQWIAGLREMEDLPYDIILPGHGPVFGRWAISKTADFLQALYDLVDTCIAKFSPNTRSDLDADVIDSITAEAFSRPEALIIKREGKNEAERQFRMIFRKRLYEYLK
jgi:glyoxylase-like metal-dependent hydrolase (beta-lactamase superfamily II)